jgi:putative ABC transport system permease protein
MTESRPVAWSLRLYRILADAFPFEFKNVYGDEMVQAAEDAADAVWRHHGAAGLVRLLADIAMRLPVEYLAELRQDVRYGLRALRASPGFTAVALISLTLGITVATCAFSELNGFVLRDVPGVQRPGELVLLESPSSYAAYREYRKRGDLFTGALAYLAPVPFEVSLGGRTERAWGHVVTSSYFEILGVHPLFGRFFDQADDHPGREPRLVVSHQFWQDRLGSDASIIGRRIRINGRPCTVIGVGPETFVGASPMIYPADFWLPVSADSSLVPELAKNALEQPELAVFHVVARLRNGVTVSRAEAALDAIERRFEVDHGLPGRDRPGRRVTLLPAGKLLPVRKQDLPMLTAFFAVLGLMILLIASSNMANMLLARAAGRRKEIAVRLAMGAGRWRLVRQLLTESALIAAAAGVLGFALAEWIMSLASRETWPYPMPMRFHLDPDLRVLLFTLALTAFTGLAFGLAPALQATRADLTTALKEGGNVQLRRFRRLSLRNLLVVSQVAGSLALLLITGFLVIGHRKITGGNVGFDPRGLSLISLDPRRDGYSAEQAADFFGKLLDRARGLSSVTAASLADAVPMTMIGKPGTNFAAVAANGAKSIYDGRKYAVGRDFFDTMGIPIVRGRSFRTTDEQNGSMSAIVSEKLARQCWGQEDPLGRRLEIGVEGIPSFGYAGRKPGSTARVLSGPTQILQVVGVARNVRDGLAVAAEEAPPVIYLPLRPDDYTHPGLQGITLLVRAVPGSDAARAVEQEIAAMDDRIRPFQVRSMPDQIEQVMYPVKVALWSYGLIGIFGLILASVGLAGVTAYSVARRRREIGIRMALGARARDVLGLVMKEGLLLVAIGATIGWVTARAGIRMLSSILAVIARTAGTSSSDPILLLGAPLLLAAIALTACYLPARRSTRIDPASSLRQE